ncbi:hypothetical protein PGTUg99_030496 [Puccinia graminis f. sp. tritici]|uniref:Uncharacterized protein n=1 Tax=Puccinia graminis f. sp. tritici TaxID=56615 RepID=A0A5B0NHK7_PUCGR|nr:hypothetical protein PGTUg99_030496 [Puccinia graminis f. sp. tritici]
MCGSETSKVMLQQQGDLVVKGFKALKEACGHPYSYCTSKSSELDSIIRDTASCSLDPLSARNAAITHLHSSLLPSLRQQLIAISHALDFQALDSIDFQREPVLSQFKLILEIQSQVHDTLEKVKYMVEAISPGEIPSSKQVNDQDLKGLKAYRLSGLDESFREDLLRSVRYFSDWIAKVIIELGISTEERTGVKPSPGTDKRYWATRVETGIESTSFWLTGSEWDIIIHDWGSKRFQSRLPLSCILTTLSHSSNSITEKPYIQRSSQLAQSALIIFKLSRLYLNKLSNRGLNQKPLRPFTEMCSHQLKKLHDLPDRIFRSHLSLLSRLDKEQEMDRLSINEVIKEAKYLSTLFQSTSFLILIHVIPLIVDTDGFPVQNYYKSWFLTYDTQFLIAYQNFCKHAASMID